MSQLPDKSQFHIWIYQDVAWGEMDAFAHVNNTTYFRYFESARIAYFRELEVQVVQDNGIGPILAHTSCQFLIPLTYPDKLQIGTRVSKIGNSSFTMENAVWSSTRGLAAYGTSIVVMVHYESGEKQTVSEAVREKIFALDGLR